ncbi:MAG: hypothetical protein ACREYF_00610 [Gammaproteobacteria bacterium]
MLIVAQHHLAGTLAEPLSDPAELGLPGVEAAEDRSDLFLQPIVRFGIIARLPK